MGRNDTLAEFDGADIERRRSALGLSRPALAIEAGVSPASVRDAEKNSRPVTVRTHLKITRALDRLETDDSPTGVVEVPVDDLRSILAEIRELRQRVEDLAVPRKSDEPR